MSTTADSQTADSQNSINSNQGIGRPAPNPGLTSSVYGQPADPVTGVYPAEAIQAELGRTLFTGTIWFAASSIASAIPLAALLASGWRPADLPPIAEVVWWLGAAIAFIGIAGFAWAGCPILAWALETAQRQKSICIRGGVGLFLFGTVLAGVALIASPA